MKAHGWMLCSWFISLSSLLCNVLGKKAKTFEIVSYINHRMIACLTNWLTDWLTEWLCDWLTKWLADWLTDWMTEWLNDWLTEWLTDWMTDWLNDWLNDWLTINDWLTEGMIFRSGTSVFYKNLSCSASTASSLIGIHTVQWLMCKLLVRFNWLFFAWTGQLSFL